MRITNNMMIRHLMTNYMNISRTMDKRLQQVATGRQFSVPSDDPVRMSQSIRTRTDLFEIEQYKKNIDDGKAWMEASESAMQSAGEILQRARELAVYAGNGTLSKDAQAAIGVEIDMLLEELMNIGNFNLAGRYIFSGQQTTTVPYVKDASGRVVYQGDPGEGVIKYEIGNGVTVQINVPSKVLYDNGRVNILDTLYDFADDLKSGTITGQAVSDYLGKIDEALDNLLRWRGEVGSRMNRMDLAKNRLEEINLYLTQLNSEQVDIDFAEVVTQLKMEENLQRAALSVGARIIQPSLVDFLR